MIQMMPQLPPRDLGEEAMYLLLALYRSIGREGWEPGPTEDEVRTRVLHWLQNVGLNPFYEPEKGDADEEVIKRTDELLRQYDLRHGWRHR